MAKFKKKKSAPTPGNDDSKPKIEENIDIPETENTPPPTSNSKEPSKDPPINAAEKSEKDKKLAKLFWMRIALGVIAGIASYVFLYLFTWIVSYTLTHLGDVSTGINL